MVLDTLMHLMQNYGNILGISLTFFGTILAIFFTLIALPIQNILGRYSQELVENVKNDKHLRFYFLFFIGTFGYDFLLLAIPPYLILILFSLFLGLVSLLILFSLVNRVFYLLDVRNQIKDISKNIKEQMNSKFGNSFEIDNKNVEWLETEIEILIDVVQKAIQENRFEIVDSGLKELVKIVKRYITLNKTILSRKMEDKFLNYVLNSLINSKSLISVNSHPKIMKSIAKSSSDIAKETLKIDTININRYNYFSPGFLNLLKEIILSFEMVKETSNMPAIACDYLADVGKTAIDLKYARVTENIIKKLSEVSRIAIKMHYFRGDLISHINGRIAYLLNYSLENLDKIGIYRIYILESMIKEIDKNIEYYLKDDHRHSFNVINTFTGSIAEYSISVIAHTLIRKIKDKEFVMNTYEKDINYDGLDLLEKILDLLDHNIKLGYNKKKYSSTLELIENTYTIGIGLIKLISELDSTESKEKPKKILENKVFLPLYNAMSEYLKMEEDSLLFKSVPIYFSLIGIAFFEDKNEILSKIIEKHVKKILNLPSEIKNNLKKLKKLYRYIRLIGSWIYKWKKDSNLLDEIKKIIKIQDEELAKETVISKALTVESRYYPDDKQIEKPIFYEYKDFTSTNNELFNDKDIKEFEKYLKNS